MRIPKRYVTCLTLFLCLMTCYFFRACMSVAVLTMGKPPNATDSHTNVTYNDGSCPPDSVVSGSSGLSFTPRLTLTSSQNDILLSAYFYGYLVMNFPGCLLAHTIGPRKTMMIALSGATFFTIINPPLTYIEEYAYHLTLLCRIGVGAFCGPLYSVMHALLSRWAPLHQRTKLTVATHSGNIFGLIVTFLTGSLVDRTQKGWEYFFYFGGVLGLVTLICWIFLVYDEPWLHPTISDSERDMLIQSLHPDGIPQPETLSHIPFLAIFTCVHVYLIAIAHMGNNFILYMFLTNHAKFLKTVFHIAASYASILSIIPFLSNFIFQLITSAFSVRLQRYMGHSTTFFRKMNGVIAFVGGAIFLSPAGFMPCSLAGFVFTEIFLSASMAILAFNQLAFFTAMIDLSPDHSDIIMGICNTFGSVSGFVSPLLVMSLVETYKVKMGWAYAFIATGFIALACGSFWLIFGTSELQPWGSHRGNDTKPIESSSRADVSDSESVA